MTKSDKNVRKSFQHKSWRKKIDKNIGKSDEKLQKTKYNININKMSGKVTKTWEKVTSVKNEKNELFFFIYFTRQHKG